MGTSIHYWPTNGFMTRPWGAWQQHWHHCHSGIDYISMAFDLSSMNKKETFSYLYKPLALFSTKNAKTSKVKKNRENLFTLQLSTADPTSIWRIFFGETFLKSYFVFKWVRPFTMPNSKFPSPSSITAALVSLESKQLRHERGALLVIGMKKRDRNCARLFYLFFALPSFTAPICLWPHTPPMTGLKIHRDCQAR